MFSFLHEIHSNIEESFQTHLQTNQIPSCLRLAIKELQVVEGPSAKPWTAAARSAAGGALHTEAATGMVPAKHIHAISHVAPYRSVCIAGCGRHSARRQLTPAIGLAKVAVQGLKLQLLQWGPKKKFGPKSNHDAVIYSNSWFSSFLTSSSSSRSALMHLAMKQNQPSGCKNQIWGGKRMPTRFAGHIQSFDGELGVGPSFTDLGCKDCVTLQPLQKKLCCLTQWKVANRYVWCWWAMVSGGVGRLGKHPESVTQNISKVFVFQVWPKWSL